MAGRAAGSGRTGRRRARRGDRRLRAGDRPGRPRLDRRAGTGHPARREGPHRGVQRAGRARARAQGHDLARPHRERRAAAGPALAGARAGPGRRRAGPPGPAGRAAHRPGDGGPLAQRGRAGHHPGQAVRHRRRRAAGGLRPAHRPDRPLPVARRQGPGGHRPGHARPARRGHRPAGRTGAPRRRAPRVRAGAHQRRPGLPEVAGLRRGVRPGAVGRRPVQPGPHHPADGRQRAGDRGLQAGPGGVQRHAAQDEHPLLRAGQRPGRGAARLPVHGRRTRR